MAHALWDSSADKLFCFQAWLLSLSPRTHMEEGNNRLWNADSLISTHVLWHTCNTLPIHTYKRCYMYTFITWKMCHLYVLPVLLVGSRNPLAYESFFLKFFLAFQDRVPLCSSLECSINFFVDQVVAIEIRLSLPCKC